MYVSCKGLLSSNRRISDQKFTQHIVSWTSWTFKQLPSDLTHLNKVLKSLGYVTTYFWKQGCYSKRLRIASLNRILIFIFTNRHAFFFRNFWEINRGKIDLCFQADVYDRWYDTFKKHSILQLHQMKICYYIFNLVNLPQQKRAKMCLKFNFI